MMMFQCITLVLSSMGQSLTRAVIGEHPSSSSWGKVLIRTLMISVAQVLVSITSQIVSGNTILLTSLCQILGAIASFPVVVFFSCNVCSYTSINLVNATVASIWDPDCVQT
jgi:hypothetical protein